MPQGSQKSNKPVEITAKTVGYQSPKGAKVTNPPKGSFTRESYGEKEVSGRMDRQRGTLSTSNSRAKAASGKAGIEAVYSGRRAANAAKKSTPNSVVSSEFKSGMTNDLSRSFRAATSGPGVAKKENTQRLANQAAAMRGMMDARKPTGATMDQKDKSGKTQTKQPPRTPVTQQSSGGGGGSTPPRRPSTSSGGGSGSGGAGGGSRRGRGVAGAALAAATAVGGMVGRMSKRGDEVAAYNKGKADGRTFTPSGLRSSGQNVAQPQNSRPGVRDNMFASENLRKLIMKGK